MRLEVKEVYNEVSETSTFHVGKFSFEQDDSHVHVFNNANAMPVFIRTATYADADTAYTAACRMASLQSRN